MAFLAGLSLSDEQTRELYQTNAAALGFAIR
jgi:hypothetical protein